MKHEQDCQCPIHIVEDTTHVKYAAWAVIAFFATLFFLTGCTNKIAVDDGHGREVIVEVKDYKVEKVQTTPVRDGATMIQTRHCTHPGICITCGLNISFEFHCGAHYFFNCPGTHEVHFFQRSWTEKEHYTTEKGIFESLPHVVQSEVITGQTECR